MLNSGERLTVKVSNSLRRVKHFEALVVRVK